MHEDWEKENYDDWDYDDYDTDNESLWDLEEKEYYVNVLEPQLNSLNGRD